MRKRTWFILGVVLVSLVSSWFAAWQLAAAEERPAGVMRTFGFFATGQAAGPDFLDEDSIGVVALPADHSSPSTIEFSACEDVSAELAGTRWVRHRARHLARDHEQSPGTFFWLITDQTPTPPPAGAVAFTGGPQGSVLLTADYRISLCNGDCCSGDDNVRWRTTNAGGTPFVIVTAWFSK